MGAHSTLGPSKAEQWVNCPGSIALCAKAPPQAPSKYAAEGTVAHSIAEKYVTGVIDAAAMQELIGTKVVQDGFEIEITEEMFDGAVDWKDLIDKDQFELDSTPGRAPVHGQAEVRVHAGSVDERVWGTSDYILFKKGKKLIAYDYKFGAGHGVDPEENMQAALYLLGAMETIAGEAFDDLEIVIHQPRGQHRDGPIRRWIVPREWLAEFKARAKAAAAKTLEPNAPIVAGDWCRWCAAKPFCPEIHKAAQERAMMTFDVPPPAGAKVDVSAKIAELRLLPIENVARLAEFEPVFKALVEAAKDVIKENLTAGHHVPGWKLVDGREGNREWIDEDAVVAHFGAALGHDKMYEKKVLSPAKLEKIIGKKNAAQLDAFVTRKPGEKAIARDTDPRPKAATAAQDTFGVIETTAVKEEDCEHKFTAQTGGHHNDCPSCAEKTDEDLMAQLGASPAAPKKREPMWPQ